jgi:hypothetical protein
VKFVLLVEGFTEKETAASFLKRWLDQQGLRQPVGIRPVRFSGCQHFLNDVATRSRMFLSAPGAQDVIGVIGLLDLYGPTFYPPHLQTVDERHQWGVTHIQKLVNQAQFRMFFAVHEFEAWILGDRKVLSPEIRKGLPGRAAQPETVNFHEPPSKLLDRLYSQNGKRGYKKVVHGRELFAKLDPSTVYENCPYLARMLDEMLNMARAAGL